MATIGDLYFRLLAESGTLEASARKEGAKAGTAAGATFASAFSPSLRTLFSGAAAGGLGLLAKQANDLDAATRGAAASAGIAAEAYGEFRANVAELYAANPSRSAQEVADALGLVKSNLGLTGEAGKAAANDLLRFAKVAREDAGASVRGLDDVLDAYQLETSESGRILDTLIVAQQRWGGSISDNRAALAAMAPALRASNMTVDDGVAILNLYAASGLDASAGQRAFNTAIANLPEGKTIGAFLEELRAIPDPTERANRAIEIFGSRGGIALANALDPGRGGLDEFRLSVTETEGALDTAAARAETFGDRITGAVRQILGPLVQLGPEAPAILSAVAGLGTIGTALDTLKTKAGLTWASFGPMGLAIVAAAVSYDQFSQAVDRGAAAQQRDLEAAEARAAALGREITELERYGATYGVVIPAEQAHLTVNEFLAQSYGTLWRATEEVADRTEGLAVNVGKLAPVSEEAARAQNIMATATRDAGAAGAEAVDTLAEAWPDAAKVAAGLAAELPDAVEEEIGRTEQGGMDTIDAYISAIDSGRSEFIDTWARFLEVQANALTDAEQMALLGGLVSSKQLAQGVEDGRPDVRNAARAVVMDALQTLIALGGAAGLAGTAAGQRFAAGFGAGAGAVGEFNPAAVSTAQILGTLNAALGTAGAGTTDLTGDIDDLRRRMLGLADDTDKAGGASKRKTAADKAAAKAERDAAKAAAERARILKEDYTDALRDATDAAKRAFAAEHDANLRSIADARKTAQAKIDEDRRRTRSALDESRKRIRQDLEEARATAMAPVTEAERIQRQIEDGRTLAGIQQSLADATRDLQDAQASGDAERIESANRAIQSANDALQSFQANAEIERLRAAAEATIADAESAATAAEAAAEDAATKAEAELDDREAAAEKAERDAVEAENAAYETKLERFDARIEELTKAIERGKVPAAKVQGEILALFADYGIKYADAGADLGQQFADGLASKADEAGAAAKKLADAAAAYLKTSSPAERGPFHRTEPRRMGANLADDWGSGVAEGIGEIRRRLQPELAPLARALEGVGAGLSLPDPMTGYGAAAGMRGLDGVRSTSGAPRTYNLTVNNPRQETAGFSLLRRLHHAANRLGDD